MSLPVAELSCATTTTRRSFIWRAQARTAPGAAGSVGAR